MGVYWIGVHVRRTSVIVGCTFVPSPEPLVWTVEGDSNTEINRIELNRIDSFVTLNRIES